MLQELLDALYTLYRTIEDLRDPIDQHMADCFTGAIDRVKGLKTKNLSDDKSGHARKESWRSMRGLCSDTVQDFVSAIQDCQPKADDWEGQSKGCHDIPTTLTYNSSMSGQSTQSQSTNPTVGSGAARPSWEEKFSSHSHTDSEGSVMTSNPRTIETHSHISTGWSHLLDGLKSIGSCLRRRR